MIGAAAAVKPYVTRSEGQRLARAELSKKMYHPSVSLSQRVVDWIANELDNLLGRASLSGRGDWWAVVALAALLVIVVAVVVFWIGPVARRGRRAGHDAALSGGELSAADHREKARQAAAAGDFSAAVIESVRAVAVGLEELGILAPRIGRTASELAAEAGGPLPGHAAALQHVARLFNDVLYGGQAGTEAGYHQARDLDTALQAARPAGQAGAPLVGSAAGPVT